jgi:hypothetical protein
LYICIYSLTPTSENDILDFIIQAKDVDGAERELVSYIYDNSQGIPAYVNALLESLTSQGTVTVVSKPSWAAAGMGFTETPKVLEYKDADRASSMQVPQSLQATIVMNIDYLDASLQLLVKICAALNDFTVHQLEHCYPVEFEGTDLLLNLQTLTKKGFLESYTGNDGERNYVFKSLVMRTVAYELLPFSYRKDMHERCASFLRSQTDQTPHPKAALIAYHWQQVVSSSQHDEKKKAHALEMSVECLQEAAEYSIFNGLSKHRAFDFLRTAMELLDELPGKLTKVRLHQRAHLLTAFIPVALAVKGPAGALKHAKALGAIPHLEKSQEFTQEMILFLDLYFRSPEETSLSELAALAWSIQNSYSSDDRSERVLVYVCV